MNMKAPSLETTPATKISKSLIEKAGVIENRLAGLHTYITSAEDDLGEDSGSISSLDIGAFKARSQASNDATKALKKVLDDAKKSGTNHDNLIKESMVKALTTFKVCISEISKEAKNQGLKQLHKGTKSIMKKLQNLVDENFPKTPHSNQPNKKAIDDDQLKKAKLSVQRMFALSKKIPDDVDKVAAGITMPVIKINPNAFDAKKYVKLAQERADEARIREKHNKKYINPNAQKLNSNNTGFVRTSTRS